MAKQKHLWEHIKMIQLYLPLEVRQYASVAKLLEHFGTLYEVRNKNELWLKNYNVQVGVIEEV